MDTPVPPEDLSMQHAAVIFGVANSPHNVSFVTCLTSPQVKSLTSGMGALALTSWFSPQMLHWFVITAPGHSQND